jgi:hypothetical protein
MIAPTVTVLQEFDGAPLLMVLPVLPVVMPAVPVVPVVLGSDSVQFTWAGCCVPLLCA